MRHVRIADMMVHVVKESVVAIHCGEGPAQPRPLFTTEVWELRVCVVQLGVQQQPKVDH